MIRTKVLNIGYKKRIIAILVIALVPLIVLAIWATNRLATYGEQINQLEKTKRALTLENEVLANKIAEKSSLSKTEQQSLNLGFEKIKNVESIQLPNLALNQ